MQLVLCLGVAICWSLCLSLETVETDSFLWFWGMGGAAGWVDFFFGLTGAGSKLAC